MIGGADYLFGVDLEDVRFMAAEGERLRDSVEHSTARYLDFLRGKGATATFFVVGDVARAYPHLVRTIAQEGHEIACHSDRHVPLDRQDREAFRDDLLRNLDALAAAGAPAPSGYRAPCFSLTARTRWAYGVLAELGFRYSSSVLPARSPIHGWPGFGEAPRLMSGVVEIPMTLVHRRLLRLPLGGGVYFRALPKPILRRAFARRAAGGAVPGYLHPYDIEEDQERIAFPGFSRGGIANRLLHYNRGAVFDRLEMVADLGFTFAPYGRHAERLRPALEAGAAHGG
jgi:polysaccharide deacetylase family protein (PEP-CTERM system associated)